MCMLSAYTVHIHICNSEYADSSDSIAFSFCTGGDLCAATEGVRSTDLDVRDQDVDVSVALGYVPTTMVITNFGTDMV